MELASPARKRITVSEYFQVAEASPTKLEYKNGEIVDMAGATYDHNRIAKNVIVSAETRLKGQLCEATGSDTRVKVANDRYCYPDVTVVCGSAMFDSVDPQRTITNPRVIFEVLSPSTEIADRGEKFFRYVQIPSLEEYFLVAQAQPRIESFFRQPGGLWTVGGVIEGMESTVPIRCLNIGLPVGEIYAGIRFTGDSSQLNIQ